MLWEECMLQCFYTQIWREKNCLYLHGKNILQLNVFQIITDFLKKKKKKTRVEKQFITAQRHFSVRIL